MLLCVTTFACSVDTKIEPSQQALVEIENEKLIITNDLFDKEKSLKLSVGKKRHVNVKLV